MTESISSWNTRKYLAVGLAVTLVALGALLAFSLTNSVSAEEYTERKVTETVTEWTGKEPLTTLTVEGAASRSVSYDGAIGRFTVNVLKPTVLEAVSAGNTAAKAIADAVEENCTESVGEEADHTAAPTCISPNGLQTTRIRIQEDFDWTEQGRVSQGFLYENGLSIAIRGTGFAGGLVDLVIKAGGDNVRFDGLDFTTSRRAETERLALLDAIDDARSTADSIAEHMGYEIVRIVEMSPTGSFSASRVTEETAEAAFDSSYEPTPIFGGSESITSRVRMVFELRPLPEVEASDGESTDDSTGS